MSYVTDLKKYEEGHFFYKEALKKIDLFDNEAYVNKDGVVRWKSNNSVPPDELLELWQYSNKEFSYENSIAIRELETSTFLAEYRRQREENGYSEEELIEMKNAFGEDAVVVDVITGEKIRL